MLFIHFLFDYYNIKFFKILFLYKFKILISIKLILVLLLSNFLPFLISVAFIVHLERKTIGLTQYRDGPFVVGFHGLLQSISDGLKLILKETIIISRANQFLFLLSPLWLFTISFTLINFIVYSDNIVLINNYISLYMFLVVNSLSFLGLFLSGWSSNSKYTVLSTLRIISQLISYELVFSLLILFIIVWYGSLNIYSILYLKKLFNISMFFQFFFFFLIFLIIILAETNRTPFDLAESESELVSGYNTEYSAFPFALFFLAEYFNIGLMSYLLAILFFSSKILINFFLILLLIILIRALLPRFRYDQLMNLCWKIFIPLLLALFIFNIGILKFILNKNFFKINNNFIYNDSLDLVNNENIKDIPTAGSVTWSDFFNLIFKEWLVYFNNNYYLFVFILLLVSLFFYFKLDKIRKFILKIFLVIFIPFFWFFDHLIGFLDFKITAGLIKKNIKDFTINCNNIYNPLQNSNIDYYTIERRFTEKNDNIIKPFKPSVKVNSWWGRNNNNNNSVNDGSIECAHSNGGLPEKINFNLEKQQQKFEFKYPFDYIKPFILSKEYGNFFIKKNFSNYILNVSKLINYPVLELMWLWKDWTFESFKFLYHYTGYNALENRFELNEIDLGNPFFYSKINCLELKKNNRIGLNLNNFKKFDFKNNFIFKSNNIEINSDRLTTIIDYDYFKKKLILIPEKRIYINDTFFKIINPFLSERERESVEDVPFSYSNYNFSLTENLPKNLLSKKLFKVLCKNLYKNVNNNDFISFFYQKDIIQNNNVSYSSIKEYDFFRLYTKWDFNNIENTEFFPILLDIFKNKSKIHLNINLDIDSVEQDKIKSMRSNHKVPFHLIKDTNIVINLDDELLTHVTYSNFLNEKFTLINLRLKFEKDLFMKNIFFKFEDENLHKMDAISKTWIVKSLFQSYIEKKDKFFDNKYNALDNNNDISLWNFITKKNYFNNIIQALYFSKRFTPLEMKKIISTGFLIDANHSYITKVTALKKIDQYNKVFIRTILDNIITQKFINEYNNLPGQTRYDISIKKYYKWYFLNKKNKLLLNLKNITQNYLLKKIDDNGTTSLDTGTTVFNLNFNLKKSINFHSELVNEIKIKPSFFIVDKYDNDVITDILKLNLKDPKKNFFIKIIEKMRQPFYVSDFFFIRKKFKDLQKTKGFFLIRKIPSDSREMTKFNYVLLNLKSNEELVTEKQLLIKLHEEAFENKVDSLMNTVKEDLDFFKVIKEKVDHYQLESLVVELNKKQDYLKKNLAIQEDRLNNILNNHKNDYKFKNKAFTNFMINKTKIEEELLVIEKRSYLYNAIFVNFYYNKKPFDSIWYNNRFVTHPIDKFINNYFNKYDLKTYYENLKKFNKQYRN